MCTCPDPKCRLHWRVSEVGGWRMVSNSQYYRGAVMTFHPDDEETARWVASNHSTEATWVAPKHIPKEG